MTDELLRRLPSPTALFVAALGAVLCAITVARGIVDADYFWHVTTGRIVATTGQIPSTDPFSFTWGGQPWVLHEWLGELIMYLLVSGAGEWAALVVFGLLPLAALAVLAWALRRRGVGLGGFAVASVLAGLVLLPYLTIRPQAISWFLLAWLIAFLWWLHPGRRAWVLALGPLFALWANLHGLWIVGLGVIGLYLLFTLVGRTGMAPARWWVLGGAAAAFIGTALTPAGPEGVLYPLRYLAADDWGRANIQEWQSPDFHNPLHLPLLGLIVALGLVAGRATPGWLTLLGWVGIVMSLLALRNAPVAAIFALPALAVGLDDHLRAWRLARERARRPRPARVALARRLMETLLAVVVIVAALAITLPRSPGVEADPGRFPVAGVDSLVEVRPEARVLADYDWGGYVIYRLYDHGGRVFVDGRNDMYDDEILHHYSAIRAADGEWAQLLTGYGVEAILLPPAAPLVRGPAQELGWCEAYRDEVQVLLLRECPRSI